MEFEDGNFSNDPERNWSYSKKEEANRRIRIIAFTFGIKHVTTTPVKANLIYQ